MPTWEITDRWKLTGSYSWYKANLRSSKPTEDEGVDYPSHMVKIRSSLDLTDKLTFDAFASYTSSYRFVSKIPGYSRIDLRLGWKPSDSINLSFGVQNAGSGRHLEALTYDDTQREAPRSYYVQGAWKF